MNLNLLALNKSNMPTEQEEFFKDLVQPNQTDVFNDSFTPEATPPEKAEEPKEEDEETKYNRRERRLQAKLQAERESSIALAARLEALTEAQKFSREQNPQIDETIARIYGTDTPEATAATNLLSKAIKDAEERAASRALDAFREEQRKEREAVKKQEQLRTTMVEEIEDELGITIDDANQKGFFTLLEKLSPKDNDGNILAYADHHAVWEQYQAKKQPATNNRAKELASRAMTKQGSSPSTTVEQDANERFLREHGII
jgi:hypothetical protein